MSGAQRTRRPSTRIQLSVSSQILLELRRCPSHTLVGSGSASKPISVRAWKANAMSLDLALGCWRSAPLFPQCVHRADRRRRSLDASPPHLMISGASAIAALRRQRTLRHPQLSERRSWGFRVLAHESEAGALRGL